MFLPNIPSRIHKQVLSHPKDPSFYSPKFVSHEMSEYSLYEYLKEYYNRGNIDMFLEHGQSVTGGFMTDIRHEYDEQILQMAIEKSLEETEE